MKTGLLASDQCTKVASGWYKTSMIPATCKSCSGEVVERTTGANTGENTTAPIESTTRPPETVTPSPSPEVTETPAA